MGTVGLDRDDIEYSRVRRWHDPTNKYAWADNAGWLNWRDTVNNYGSAQVFADHLEGDIWAENIGWIRLGSFSGGGAHTYANTARNAHPDRHGEFQRRCNIDQWLRQPGAQQRQRHLRHQQPEHRIPCHHC